MGALMRAFDWSSTRLGPPEHWPLALQMMTRMLLANSFPILLWWGSDFIQIYNDAYIPVLGKKHPHAALGKPFRECWSEVYHVLGPLAEVPYKGGQATWIEDIPVELNRHGYHEEAHFTISYSPVPDIEASGGIGGVVAIVHEISAKVVSERRILALRDLGGRPAELSRAEDACDAAAKTLASHSKDVPFCLVYLNNEDGKIAQLAGRAGMEECSELCPQIVDLSRSEKSWPLAESALSEGIVLIDDLTERFDRIPEGPWTDPPTQAAIVPIKSTKAHQLEGFLIAGISSRLRFDDSYSVFLELASAQISIAVANARAFELERKRDAALAEIDRAKTAFFSNISHEFRTPLTLVLSPLEDMLAEPSTLARANLERLELVHRNSLRLLKQVNTLLDFSRIEAGRNHACYEPVDLSQFVVDLASAFRSIVERAGLKFTIDCSPLPEPVYIDREMWEKIVFNLLSNAFKFTFDGEIKVALRGWDDRVEMAISDTGTGIAAEQIPEIFKRFHQVRGAPSRSYEGSGIGLALVKELVQLHGGSVHIESEPGAGSRFIVCLPLGTAHLPAERIHSAGEASPAPHIVKTFVDEAERWLANESAVAWLDPRSAAVEVLAKPDADKELVVVAEDNADMRAYIVRILEPEYRVIAVSDGTQAIEAIERLHPGLVLADVMMPALDGFALLRAVRTNPDLNGTAVILLSARAGEEARVEGLRAGADDYLMKPFSAREMLARIESHLALARLRRQAENEIRRSEERFRAFVAASSDAVFQMSPDWKIMRNLAGRRLLPDTESPDQSWLSRYIHPDDQPRVVAAIEDAIRTKSAFQLEHRVLRTDGTLGWTLSRAVPLMDANGQVTEWFGTATDITAQKRAEQALLHSERLASLGRMAATISHEINNPLEALANLLYLASIADGLPSEARDRLAEADTELQRIAHITRQALGFYRESSSPSVFNINVLMESTIDLLKRKISAKQVSVETQWRAKREVTGVAGELRQVFSNLLANSLDAVDDGGRVKLRISACTMRDNHRGLRITFADDGKGVDPAARARIFEPFYTTKGAVGTGLGLWVSRQIIEKHRGLIQVRSSSTGPHRGSTFSVMVPV